MGYEDAYEVAHNEGYDTLVIAKERGFTGIHVLKAGYLTTRLFEELPLSARRLVGEEQESFLELSRMEGEVQFRFALAIPLAVATSVVTFGLGVSIWVWLAASCAGALAGAALLADGWRRDRRRNELLVGVACNRQGKVAHVRAPARAGKAGDARRTRRRPA